MSFFEADTTVSEWSRAQRHGERVPLNLDYLMASLGIPFLFPPMCLHGEYFGDGAMRQTAPLSPAIHLGADRLLIVGVRPTHLDLVPRFVSSDSPPTPGQLFGYMLDTLFSDQISADLENLSRINRLSARSETTPPRNARVSTCCDVLLTTSHTPPSGRPPIFSIGADGARSTWDSFVSLDSLTALFGALSFHYSLSP